MTQDAVGFSVQAVTAGLTGLSTGRTGILG